MRTPRRRRGPRGPAWGRSGWKGVVLECAAPAHALLRPRAQAASRKVVSVFNKDDKAKVAEVPLPAVFTAPIRTDIVQFVHTNMAKNSRQAYAVSTQAGHQTSAQSWGTGRAVARIPRVGGGGTSRSGQGAFGNMCRGGRMFGPTKTWRRWHRRINTNQKRYAVASALAASALTPLVLARGHRVEGIPELPLVVDNSVQQLRKTRDAVKMLSTMGAFADVEKSRDSKAIRRGKGKMRNRRYVLRRGPLMIYDGDREVARAFRNLPGVELANVNSLNLLQLAPGGHLGRFCVWTQAAFEKLDSIFGTYSKKAEAKTDYTLPRHLIANADIARVVNSDEIQSKVKTAKKPSRFAPRKKNPLRNRGLMVKLNPHALVNVRRELRNAEARKERKQATVQRKRTAARKAASRTFYNKMQQD